MKHGAIKRSDLDEGVCEMANREGLMEEPRFPARDERPKLDWDCRVHVHDFGKVLTHECDHKVAILFLSTLKARLYRAWQRRKSRSNTP